MRHLLGQLLHHAPEECPASFFLDYGRLLTKDGTSNSLSHAERVLLHGCTRFGENVCLWTELGAVYLAQEAHDKAQRALSQATALDPTNPNAWALLAILFLRTNKLDPASHVHFSTR